MQQIQFFVVIFITRGVYTCRVTVERRQYRTGRQIAQCSACIRTAWLHSTGQDAAAAAAAGAATGDNSSWFMRSPLNNFIARATEL